MEKYCPNCGRVLGDVDYKLCPYCGTKLNKREGRKHIPGYLRHQVFERDNYRCVQCGASNKETTLEIDHIIPVSKGGKNELKNLQTLCKECNRAKGATIWEDGNLNHIQLKKDEINRLKNKKHFLMENFKYISNENNRIDYEYRLQRIEERINQLAHEIENLKNKEYEQKQKELMYKKLYILDSESFDALLRYLGIDMNMFKIYYSMDKGEEKRNILEVEEIVNSREFQVKSILRHRRLDIIKSFFIETLNSEVDIKPDYINCPTCGKEISADFKHLNKKCPHCGHKFKNNKKKKKNKYSKSEIKASKERNRKIPCSNCGKKINVKFVNERKKCPYCGHKFKGNI